GDSEVLAGRQEVFNALGQQRAQGDLERQGADVDVVVPSGAGVQVDAVAADTDRVRKGRGAHLLAARPGLLHARLGADVLFEDGELGPEATAFPYVRVLGHAVFRPHNIGTEPQPLPTAASVGSGRLGLKPVKQGQVELAGSL